MIEAIVEVIGHGAGAESLCRAAGWERDSGSRRIIHQRQFQRQSPVHGEIAKARRGCGKSILLRGWQDKIDGKSEIHAELAREVVTNGIAHTENGPGGATATLE